MHPKLPSEIERGSPALRRAMSIDEFCAAYGPGRTTAYLELRSGRLRGRKIGRRTLITQEDAENWLRNLPLAGGRNA
jgi:hypothetical protein